MHLLENSAGSTYSSTSDLLPRGGRIKGQIKSMILTDTNSVQFSHSVQLFMTPWTAACQASLSVTNSRSLLKLMPIELAQTHVMPSHPLSCLLLLPSILPSIRVFSSESVLHIRWPKYWSFSFTISPSSGYSGLISFRTDWLNLLGLAELFSCPITR